MRDADRYTENKANSKLFGGIGAKDFAWLFAVSLMLFIVLLPFSSYVAALPIIKEQWAINNTQAGIVYSAFLAGYAFSALIVIPLTDRIGSKPILIIAIVLSIVSHLLFARVATGMTPAILLRILAGVGLVGVYNPGMRLVAERFANRRRGMAVGTFVTAFYAAHAVSLAVSGGLMNWFDWQDAYLIITIVSMAGLPLAILLLWNHRHVASAGSSAMLDVTVLKNRMTRLYILGYSLHAVELYIVRVWLPVFLAAILIARGQSVAQAAATAATVAGLSLAFGSIGPVMGGVMSDRWGRPVSASAIFALSGACSMAIGWLGEFPWAVVVGLTVVYGWAIAADSAIYSTAVTETADKSKLGSTLAVHSFLGFMGGVVGPIVMGMVLDVVPESLKWGVGFSATGALAIVAIAGLMRIRALEQSNMSEDSQAGKVVSSRA